MRRKTNRPDDFGAVVLLFLFFFLWCHRKARRFQGGFAFLFFVFLFLLSK